MGDNEKGNHPYSYDILWERDYHGGKGHVRVVTDSKNNIYACGISSDESHGVVVKYSSDGDIEWSDTTLPTIHSLTDAFKMYNKAFFSERLKKQLTDRYGSFFDITVDSEDNVIVTGTFVEIKQDTNRISYKIIVKKYRSNGEVIWKKILARRLFNCAWGITVDSNDDIYIVGMHGLIVRGLVMKLSKLTGSVLWTRSRKKGKIAWYNSVSTDTHGTIFAAGFLSHDGTHVDTIITKFDGKNGLRKKEIIRPGDKQALAIIRDADNTFVIVGRSLENETHYILKCNSNLSVIWEKVTQHQGSLYGASIMNDGNIAVTGSAPLDEYYAAIYSQSNGIKLFDMTLGNLVSNNIFNDYLKGITMDSQGDLILVGSWTLGKTIKVRLTNSPTPSSPASPVSPTTPPPKKESIIQKILRFLFGK
jgi:hypothetical protein